MAFPNENTQFKKGQSGNPNGRPEGTKSFKTILNKVLDGVMTIQEAGEAKQMTKRELLAMELGIIALDRSANKNARLKAIDMILDRIEGKPQQEIVQTNYNHDLSDEELLVLRQDAKEKGIAWEEYKQQEGIDNE